MEFRKKIFARISVETLRLTFVLISRGLAEEMPMEFLKETQEEYQQKLLGNPLVEFPKKILRNLKENSGISGRIPGENYRTNF